MQCYAVQAVAGQPPNMAWRRMLRLQATLPHLASDGVSAGIELDPGNSLHAAVAAASTCVDTLCVDCNHVCGLAVPRHAC
eukprot:364721-Chlamydomonas_euryale.AAC.14